jgi:hypothetical protein
MSLKVTAARAANLIVAQLEKKRNKGTGIAAPFMYLREQMKIS